MDSGKVRAAFWRAMEAAADSGDYDSPYVDADIEIVDGHFGKVALAAFHETYMKALAEQDQVPVRERSSTHVPGVPATVQTQPLTT